MTSCERTLYLRGYCAACRARVRAYQAPVAGRPANARRARLVEKYGLSPFKLNKISARLIDQLERCKDEDARLLLLGIGEQV